MNKTQEFLNEIEALSRKFGLCLGHQDSHGAFTVEPFDQRNIDWLKEANDETKKKVEVPVAADMSTIQKSKLCVKCGHKKSIHDCLASNPVQWKCSITGCGCREPQKSSTQ